MEEDQIIFKKPWFRLLAIGLITLLVGGAGAYEYFVQEKQDIQKQITDTVVEVTNDLSSPEPSSTADTTNTNPTQSSSGSSSQSTNPSNSSSTSNSSSSGSSSSSSDIQTKTINDTATKTVAKSYGYCNALAPEDWSFTANNEATGADLWSPDLNFHAGWGIAFAYSYLLPNDEAFLNYYLKLVYNTQNVSLTSGAEDAGYGYSRRYYQGTTDRDFKGAVYYQHYDASSLGGYIMVTRFGTTESSRWDSQGGITQAAALSIRCTTQLKSSNSSNTPSNSSDNDEASIDISDKWQEAIMGYENVYNPSTGQHWEAPTSSYWDTGPQGGGYYYQNGNDLTKLSRGFGSY